jgi:hypothetical protein
MAPQVITRDDLVSLIERLSARGRSRVGTDTTSVKADIVLASRLIARWLQRGVDLGLPLDLND